MALFLAGGLAAGTVFADSDRSDGSGDPKVSRSMRGKGHFGREFGGPAGWMRKNLELTDEQTDRIQRIHQDARKKAIRLRADLRVAGIDLVDLLTRDAMDKEKVEETINQIGQATQQLFRNRMDTFLKFREVLTPSQRKKARPLIRWMLFHHPGGFSKARKRVHRERETDL